MYDSYVVICFVCVKNRNFLHIRWPFIFNLLFNILKFNKVFDNTFLYFILVSNFKCNQTLKSFLERFLARFQWTAYSFSIGFSLNLSVSKVRIPSCSLFRYLSPSCPSWSPYFSTGPTDLVPYTHSHSPYPIQILISVPGLILFLLFTVPTIIHSWTDSIPYGSTDNFVIKTYTDTSTKVFSNRKLCHLTHF